MKPLLAMDIDQLNASLEVSEKFYSNELLSWFADQEHSSVHRDEFVFNGKKTYRFCANLNGEAGLSGFGRAQDEQTAAVKACAEAIERSVYSKFLKAEGLLNLKINQTLSDVTIEENSRPARIAKSFHNSNGWAVGFSSGAAIERAKVEALERHLLLLTFIKDGWSGFYEISRISVDGIEFVSLLSKYTLAGYSAGIGIARSHKFSGASFGYICDRTENIKTSPRWEQAFYESFDYVRVRETNSNIKTQRNLIEQELDYFLQNKFNEKFLKTPSAIDLGDHFTSDLVVIDLRNSLNLRFPFFAAAVHGGSLLPLYFKKSLKENDEVILKNLLSTHKIFHDIPERHPIL